MRLIELTANQQSFRTVTFNPIGLTLIVGKKSDPEDRALEHSTNGVGKSLLLYLVSFCLGSRSNQQLKDHLPKWEFTLRFEVGGTEHSVRRSTEDQESVVFDGKPRDVEQFREDMGKELFGLPSEPIKYLTFRTLVGLFLRQGKPAYISHDMTSKSERQYTRQLRTAYLLGLDEQLVDKKRELKEEKDQIKVTRSQFKKDSLLREYFHGDKDASLELKDLQEEIEKLEGEVRDFRVADNYEEVTAEADKTRRNWRRTRNELNSHQALLRQIEASLTEQPDVSLDEVRTAYASAQVELSDAVIHKLEEVTKFHEELVKSRSVRLTTEKHQIERRIAELEEEVQSLDALKDEYYRFLGSHGALTEYETLLTKLSERKKLADRLSDFQKLKKQCDDRWQRNKLDMSAEDVRTTEYLEAAEGLTDAINERFRSMARRIWPNHTCGLVVKNNEGDNQLRFTIEATIQGDASDGIGESKIFCFDMTVLLGADHHELKFLMHDNRLFAAIDHRQRAELFRIANALTRDQSCQYIATINDENLVGMKSIMEEDEFSNLLSSNVVMELMDDSDAGK
ncbi:MAG: DUF2326 domain-containing protein [Planctomycetaceae bacterium]|nr:DUF2326 domain-containing protein [Planctomycetaceae bacterium]